VRAWTSEAAGIVCKTFDEAEIENNAMRACDGDAAAKMLDRVIELKAAGDSAGGIISCQVTGLPPGLGEPVFDKLDARIAQAVLSIGAIKGIEFGAGFEAARMAGSENNDPMRRNPETGKTEFLTNNAGGVLGGLSTGADLVFRAAVKPVSSISREQKTVDTSGNDCTISVHGRHDVCLCPRIVPVIEAMTALTIVDLYLVNRTAKLS
jgi:chorismate synthase